VGMPETSGVRCSNEDRGSSLLDDVDTTVTWSAAALVCRH